MSATKEVTHVSFTATGTPEGLEVSTAGKVSGTPTGDVGVHPVAVEVSTNYGKATGSVTVTVEAPAQETPPENEETPVEPGENP